VKILVSIILVLAISSSLALAYDGSYPESSHFFTQNLHNLVVSLVHLSTTFLSAQSTSNFSTPNGIIVPLYADPGDDWERVIQAKIDHPLVPILAVINPQNGSGHFQNPDYTVAVKKLKSEHIVVLGYVYTQYGSRNSTEIKTEIANYKSWYDVDGIFFDEMSNMPGNEVFYKKLNEYTKSIDMNYTVGNPGQDVPKSYIGTVDNLVIYDNPGLPPISSLGSWHANFTKNDFSIMSFNVNKFDQIYAKNASHYVKYLYITNGTMPDPWHSISPYLENLTTSIQMATFTENQQTKIKTSVPVPLKQFKSGILANDVICKEGLQLVIKTEDGSPACMYKTTAQKLVERGGWITPVFNDTHSVGDAKKTNYS
jgi:Spherulation-specific family 4